MKITFSDNIRPFDAGSDASAEVDANVIVVTGPGLPADLDPAARDAATAAKFEPKAGRIFEAFLPHGGHTVRTVLVGAPVSAAGSEANGSAAEAAGAALAARYVSGGVARLLIDVGRGDLSAVDVAALLTGLALRSWRHDRYRTRLKDEQKASLQEAVVYGAPSGTEAAWEEASALVTAVEFTRELVTEPPNIIYPESFVARCQERFAGTGATLEVLDEDQMRTLGMGALLGVSLGSEREARLLCIRWEGGTPGDRPTVFVGKGVTFDSGGISIKPGAGMEDMKWDMGGAGAVAGAMLALATRKAKANVIGVCGLVENMPDGKAMRPGDVITTMNGQTVEVLNTDAEGRLVLSDALTWIQRNAEAKQIVDLATLTGAMIIALGYEHGGLFANNDELADRLLQAGRASGDKLWRLPLSPAYDKLIDSPIADIKNVGPRHAGSITAAQFIQRFIENDTPWAHLDIAGMVWADKPGATWDKGATGYGVRLIERFVRDYCEG